MGLVDTEKTLRATIKNYKQRIIELEKQVEDAKSLLREIREFVYGGNHRPPITAQDFRPLMKKIDAALKEG
jgi:hypothetical protein